MQVGGCLAQGMSMPPANIAPDFARVSSAILEHDLATEGVYALRQCASACLDYVFMSQAEPRQHTFRDDIALCPENFSKPSQAKRMNLLASGAVAPS